MKKVKEHRRFNKFNREDFTSKSCVKVCAFPTKRTPLLLHPVGKILRHQVFRFVVEIQGETISKENRKCEEDGYSTLVDDSLGKHFFA